ncbi:hypothetical protein LXL04_027938 [Taraxacum kok-saghyz]
MSSSWYALATMERDELVLAGSHMGIRQCFFSDPRCISGSGGVSKPVETEDESVAGLATAELELVGASTGPSRSEIESSEDGRKLNPEGYRRKRTTEEGRKLNRSESDGRGRRKRAEKATPTIANTTFFFVMSRRRRHEEDGRQNRVDCGGDG